MVEILFENDEILAVNKPEGLASIRERQNPAATESLYEILCAERGGNLLVVHRLDKDTSGVIVFAKSAQAHRWLGRQFEQRTAQKVYLALVHGVVAAEAGAIDKPLGQRGSGRISVSPQHGRAAYTEYAVLHRFAAHTLVEAYPKTGRRHQIRVHLYSIGHPIVGDRLYGDRTIQRAYPRMMLHAHRLTLRLPDGPPLILEAQPPDSFDRVLQAIAAA